jgi:hypothetical protein
MVAGIAASAILGLALALALPLSREPLSGWLVAGVAFLGAVLPVMLVTLWPRTPLRGHTASGLAVRFLREGELLFSNDRYALELARENGTNRERARFREVRGSWLMVPATLCCPALALLVLHASSPIVRIVNLTGEPLIVSVDGRAATRVDSTSVESSTAGVEVRIAAGRHELVARSPRGSVLEEASVLVAPGRPHLFAPASNGHCFFLETRGYGRGDRGGVTREPLEGPPHFWSLPRALAGFFQPAPDGALTDARLTGGVVTVVRQEPCDGEL